MRGFLERLIARFRDRRAGLPAAGRLGIAELARRLGLTEAQLRAAPVTYRRFQIPKQSGGTRTILAPAPPLKAVQRRILRRLLAGLAAHPGATGFERGHSIVTNALPHVGREVVVRLDLKDFFPSTSAVRVESYFRTIGWDADAARLLTRLCTHEGSLPQGAPTSPRLSNLVNHRLDARLAALAGSRQVSYSRYADDLTFSGAARSPHAGRRNPKTLLGMDLPPDRVNDLIHAVKRIVESEGYTLHTSKKLRIMRAGDRKLVTGLVVNERVNLPRAIRRRLRAIEHHLSIGQPATLSRQQMDGWKALQKMIAEQSQGDAPRTGPPGD
jgi:retron-type reverse transcriptase